MILAAGHGDPVTVVAHGFGQSLAEARVLASGVPGTRVLYEARGHGTGPAPIDPGYGELAADLLEVADAHAATQALGASMGAGALLRVLALQPDRFDRVVLFLPAAIDGPRGDVSEVDRLTAAVPPGVEGPAVDAYLAERAAFLETCDLDALGRAMVTDRPVADRAVLSLVTADVLVVGQEGDPVHPASVARELADLMGAQLHVFPSPGVLFTERTALRRLISGHLGH